MNHVNNLKRPVSLMNFIVLWSNCLFKSKFKLLWPYNNNLEFSRIFFIAGLLAIIVSFIDSVKKLPIERFIHVPYDFFSFNNINKIISDYKSHPSILKIRDLVKTGIKFDFDLTTPEDLKK